MPYPIPANEERRVEALRRHKLLDTPAEQAFDDFTLLASYICGTPIALISLIDSNRQWLKAKVGIEASETPREQAFCAHTIMSDELFLVEDATQDSRFAENPMVTADPHIRFYAGEPLIDSEGLGMGSLCVIDRTPRQLSTSQKQALKVLAKRVVAQFELRQVSNSLAEALVEINILRGFLPICSYCKSIRNDDGYWKSIEHYISIHSDAQLSHGICPECLKAHHPDVHARIGAEGKD